MGIHPICSILLLHVTRRPTQVKMRPRVRWGLKINKRELVKFCRYKNGVEDIKSIGYIIMYLLEWGGDLKQGLLNLVLEIDDFSLPLLNNFSFSLIEQNNFLSLNLVSKCCNKMCLFVLFCFPYVHKMYLKFHIFIHYIELNSLDTLVINCLHTTWCVITKII